MKSWSLLILLVAVKVNAQLSDGSTLFTLYQSSAEEEGLSTESIIFDLIKESLQGIQFSQVHAGVARSLKALESEANVCIRNVVKNPERESVLYFSYPQTIFLGLKAYFSPGAYKRLAIDDGKPIDIGNFVTKHNLILGVDRDRSYGEFIDNEIAAIPAKNKFVKSGKENESQMAKMLLTNRIDVWLEYQSVMSFNHNQYAQNLPLHALPLIGVDQYITGHLACKKSPASLLLIKQINHRLIELYSDPRFYQAHVQFIASDLTTVFDQAFKHALEPLKGK
ncbi:hypothetical protein [Colwellia sp. MEBiC06753]